MPACRDVRRQEAYCDMTKGLTCAVFVVATVLTAACDSTSDRAASQAPATSHETRADRAETRPSLPVKEQPVTSEPTTDSTPSSTPRSTTESTPSSTPRADHDASALLNPSEATAQSPDVFKIQFETTKGPFVVQVTREWAPRGADRLYNLVSIGYFRDVAFFRVIDRFMVQFGIHGDPAVNRKWRMASFRDDEVKQSNERGMLTFATSGRDSRTTQMFINFNDNGGLDGQGFSPVGRVIQGMSVVDSLYNGYGEGAPSGRGPDQGRIQSEGNAYLKSDFPKLDYIKSASIESP